MGGTRYATGLGARGRTQSAQRRHADHTRWVFAAAMHAEDNALRRRVRVCPCHEGGGMSPESAAGQTLVDGRLHLTPHCAAGGSRGVRGERGEIMDRSHQQGAGGGGGGGELISGAPNPSKTWTPCDRAPSGSTPPNSTTPGASVTPRANGAQAWWATAGAPGAVLEVAFTASGAQREGGAKGQQGPRTNARVTPADDEATGYSVVTALVIMCLLSKPPRTVSSNPPSEESWATTQWP